MALNDSSREDTLISRRVDWYKYSLGLHISGSTDVPSVGQRTALSGLGDAGSVGLRTCLLSMSTADPQKARCCTRPNSSTPIVRWDVRQESQKLKEPASLLY